MTVLGCDMGATRLKLGLVREGQVPWPMTFCPRARRWRWPTACRNWRVRCGGCAPPSGLSLADCRGVSMSVPSLIDAASGRLLAPLWPFPGYALARPARLGQSRLGLPLALENDARMAAIGEWRYGAGRGCDNLVMITLGTGLGTSAVMEGRMVRGAMGRPDVLGGHLTVRYGGRSCGCGNIGCAEAEASTGFLPELARARRTFRQRAGQRAGAGFCRGFPSSRAGDPCAQSIRDQSLLVWSSLAVNLIHAYDPELVIFGGGIMASADVILPAVREYVRRHAHTPWGKVRVVASELGDSAALVAGEWLLQEQFPNL